MKKVLFFVREEMIDESEITYKEYKRAHLPYAREMRKKPTLAEQKMREYLLKHRPCGYKFTRQKPLGSFIVDFYCAKLSLAIEVDGEIHELRFMYDKERDLYLSDKGITTIRYKNDDVLGNLDVVYKNLLVLFQELEKNRFA